jgi:hypothetical protein
MYFYRYVYVFFHRARLHSSATLTEVFPCFLLSCKANVRVKTCKAGARPALNSRYFCVVLRIVCFLCCSMYCLFWLYCLCVNVY